MSLQIYLVRHGETAWNAERRFQGQLDSPLTRRGREQAGQNGMLLAKALTGRSDVTMHASPLGRTQETAAIVQAHLACEAPTSEPRIQEVTVGSWDGLTHADIDAGWPSALDGATGFDWYFRAPDGEGYDVAVERVRSWLADADGSIVAISHGLIGRLIRGAYLGLPRDEALTLPVPQDVVWLLAQGRVEALAG
jgi:broad specificity phosphatase PhoE